jgi:two-component system sensor histidine kinase RegB
MQQGRETPGAWYLAAAPDAGSKWLVWFRRATAAIDATVVVTALVLPATTFPLRRLLPLIAAAALAHLELAREASLSDRTARWIRAASIGVDIALLTGLLELSGGPSNAFSVVYVVLVALAGATLGRVWAGIAGAWALVCYGVLIGWHLEELVPAHHRLVDFPTHLFMMWLTIGALVQLAAHFVREASTAVAGREAQIEDMRRHAARTEHMMALTTLAAGAAHELSTPLATIAIASRELERTLMAAPAPLECSADARLIRREVDRCQLILDQMSGRAGGSAAESATPASVDALIADVVARLNSDQVERLRIQIANSLPSIVAPRAGLVQVLLSLIKNAFDATEPTQPVSLDVTATSRSFRFAVENPGSGMSPDVLRRAGEPFFTTKEPGRGVGLGLFLARIFAERCGGSLSLRSGRSTIAVLELPIETRAEVA